MKTRIASALLILVLTLATGWAAEEPDRSNLIVLLGDFAAAHVADGGGWSTTFVLTNLGSREQTGEILLFQDGGAALAMDFRAYGTTARLPFTIERFGTFIAETRGTASSASVGFAVMLPDDLTTDEIGGAAIFRRGGSPIFEAVVPFANLLQSSHILPFDHRNGYASGLAIANPSSTAGRKVAVLLFDREGEPIFGETIELSALGHTAFMLNELFPESVGKVGQVRIHTLEDAGESTGLLVVGLRANPSGTFTTVFSMIPMTKFTRDLE